MLTEKSMYVVTVFNDDRTKLEFAADNKLDAVKKYNEYIQGHRKEGFIDEEQDFDVEWAGTFYI